MEKIIREYEKYIAREVKREMGTTERARLAEYHREMMANFQHERLIHLLVTLFFALFATAAMFVMAWIIYEYGLRVEMVPPCFSVISLAMVRPSPVLPLEMRAAS